MGRGGLRARITASAGQMAGRAGLTPPCTPLWPGGLLTRAGGQPRGGHHGPPDWNRFGLRPGPARPCHPVMPSFQTAQNRTPRAKLRLDSVWRAPWEKAGGLLQVLLCGCCLNTLHPGAPEHIGAAGRVGRMAGARPASMSCVGHGVLHISSSVLFPASGRQPCLLLCGLSRLQVQTWSSC